ncbi:hypothetical protein TIFTF001_014555 [Ficus carica]|uniref:Uncharacterized protein n=1 Tax=Ficus carica TaxID=3494 RepID=A0AA88A5I9_FICCA|nr:hypothetical protein TIFTF001_014555 [Ficus carica]
MPKISGTTPDVIAWPDRSCTVTLRRVTYKREAPRSDGDTGGVSVTSTPILKRSSRTGYSGDSIGLNSEFSRQVDMLQVHKHRVSNRPIPRVHGTTTSGASGVGRQIECCDRVPPSARTGRCDADSEGPTELVALRSCQGSSVRANGTSPGRALSGVHNGYRQCGELGSVNEVARKNLA